MNFQINTGEELFLVVILAFLVFGALGICVAVIHLYLSVKQLALPAEKSPKEDLYAGGTFWNRLFRVPPSSANDSLLMEHAPDGIQELDNPTPPWFMFLFYGTIVFAAVYLVIYHVAGDGDIMNREYTTEIAAADKAREAYLKKFANSVNENNVTVLKDAKAVTEGKKLFDQYCVACHGSAGEGKVGPNLTDEYWLHGGTVKAVFHTITEGVPDKGMLSWKKQLNPIQIQQVTSYIFSLKGSNPAGAKEPQGEKLAAE
ncbi:cbb3-type cytochrome c oxidase N-terminal domain-containing protein [Siphonobacter aquaeclarae]|uniref:Cytochrome c oxidase cbb3-type subunit 3 n=1 Tax=Siphonobacter aquaeclarae TaxID=563176 RepID=A0A1G9QGH0_9BACT|nr:cbb3-type cytochrome c oxidase N-terminal domain-containing protein [Siphonobacter aquaeclarae]MBO9637391.1 c-type cytochrome [Siphonobacter aquaeclarae]SDM10128.1 cytochrome c oxidase cbb3-type subunit 3 [Siphonobacter aquaeclarae]